MVQLFHRLPVIAAVVVVALSFPGSADGEGTSTTTDSGNVKTFTGATMVLLDNSENQIQARVTVSYSAGKDYRWPYSSDCSAQGTASWQYSISPNHGSAGSDQHSGSTGSQSGFCGSQGQWGTFNQYGLTAGTTYMICATVSHTYGGSASACLSVTTLGGAATSTTSSTVGSGPDTNRSSTTSVPQENGGYMVLLDTQRRAVQVLTKSQYDADFARNLLGYGGCGCFVWVASTSAPSLGMIHDGAGGFAWPSSTTTTTILAVTTRTTVATQPGRTTTSSVLPSISSKRPVSPQGVSISSVGSGVLRVRWSDVSSDEEGFVLQRSDAPVPGGTSTSKWPYKTAAGQTSFDISGLSAGKQVCVAVASFTKTSASSFTEWVCATTPGGSGEAVATTLPSEIPSLSCDSEIASVSKGLAAVSINAGVANAGKQVQFEIYKAGRWYSLGNTRISASGVAIIQTDSQVLNQRGKFAIRGTQGSRFICEGNIDILRNLRLRGALKLSNRS